MKRTSYKTNCPVCPGHNFLITEDNGMGYCFNCGHLTYNNEHYDQKPKERSPYVDQIRVLYAQVAQYYHSALDGKARLFLINRGFTDETIQKLKIGYAPEGTNPIYKTTIAQEAGIATYAATAFLAGRVTFPYFYDEHTIIDIRGRSIEQNDDLKYKSPYHNVYYRGADYIYNNHLTTAKEIILTEGEIKADIAVQNGFPTGAFPGMLSTRIFNQQPDQKVILLFDSQKNDQMNINRAINRQAQKLQNPFIATLPLMGKPKQDIDSFILNYGCTTFKIVLESALPYNEWRQLQRF